MKKCIFALLFFAGALPGVFSQGAVSRAEAGKDFPVKSVVLFTNGVGYFSREGTITGSGSIELLFDTKDVNDLLKSMVVRDLDGGAILGVEYASREPLERTLKGFSLDLSGAPGFSDIAAQARGEQVVITADKKYEGTILGTEERGVSGQTGEEIRQFSETYINLFGAEGMQSIPLKSVRSLQFQNPRLRGELESALRLVSESRNTEKKSVFISCAGEGRRRIQALYITETPVWKTSYRLILNAKGKHLLQGWGIVENSTDEDWKGIRLELISGMPVSFAMNLYQPLFNPRPLVPYSVQDNLASQEYAREYSALPEAPQGLTPPAYRELNSAKKAPAPAASARADEAAAGEDMGYYAEAGARAEGEAAGEFFRYTIAGPVDLKRRQSAMIPILNEEIEGERLSIYNETVHAKHPMNGLLLKNTSPLSLMGGPLTVYEDGLYAGDARMDSLEPAAQRLISYSLDLSTEVSGEAASPPELITSVRLQKGVLAVTKTLRREKTYTLINRDPEGLSRPLIIEHPVSFGWNLVEPASGAERTDSAYRFKLRTPAGRDAVDRVLAAEERVTDQTIGLTNMGSETILFYTNQKNISPAVRAALEKLSVLKNELSDLTRQRQEAETRVASIHKEQERIRGNMNSLDKTSALYQRYVSTLNDQENTLADLNGSLQTLRGRETEKKKAIDDYLAGLEVK
jgi:chaperonin cofactor prefoldin